MQSGQSYSKWATSLRGITRGYQFNCKSEACNHRIFADEQICDVIIQQTLHVEIRRQCLIEPKISLNDMLFKPALYTRTLKTDKLLPGTGGISVNKMTSQDREKWNHSNKKITGNCSKKASGSDVKIASRITYRGIVHTKAILVTRVRKLDI